MGRGRERGAPVSFDTETRRFVVSGRVQGVGYRAYAARAARALSLSGLARNLFDGRVEVIVTGPVHALLRYESALLEGPRLSRVDEVRTEKLDQGPPAAPADDWDVEF